MQPNDVRVLKSAAVPTAAVGLLVAVVAMFLTGLQGVLGAAIGVAVVAAFFTISVIAVSWAGRISPQMMGVAAMVSYLIKLIALLAMVKAFENVTAFDAKVFAWSVVVCTIVWTIGEVRGFLKLKLLYVEPGVKVPGQGDA